MLPPTLEIYAVWHPNDPAGQTAAQQFIAHFHGTAFSGLIGGAVEIYVRSAGWRSEADAPRPIPFPGAPSSNGLKPAEIIAVVPVIGLGFAGAVEEDRSGPWHAYATAIAEARAANRRRVFILPLSLDRRATDMTEISRIFDPIQFIAAPHAGAPAEPEAELRCRDLAQSIAQMAQPERQRLKIFISHTKHASPTETDRVTSLIERVRVIIGQTRLGQFFDANDLQPGENYDSGLRENAGAGALLALRTDLYSSREWCQREILIAKRAGLPVVILDVPDRGDERGSFLMDHVPRVPLGRDEHGWCDADIRRALDMLVDQSLKRVLWMRQKTLAEGPSGPIIGWWAPHAPEPATLAHWIKTEWLSRQPATTRQAQTITVLHPDPPLGHEERQVLEDIVALGCCASIDIMTPRVLAARGG